MAVTRHNDSMFELVIYCLLNVNCLWRLSGVTLTLLGEAHHLFINKFETVVNRQVFTDVINNKVNSTLENPRRSEKAGPSLNSVVKNFSLGGHKETRVSSYLAEFRVAHLGFYDGVDET